MAKLLRPSANRACRMPLPGPLPTTSDSCGPSVGLIVERHRIVLVASAGEAAEEAGRGGENGLRVSCLSG